MPYSWGSWLPFPLCLLPGCARVWPSQGEAAISLTFDPTIHLEPFEDDRLVELVLNFVPVVPFVWRP